MAKLRDEDVAIGHESGQVTMRLTIDGKPRRFAMSPRDALLISQRLGNEAADVMPAENGLPRVENIRLRPFDQSGTALLQLALTGFGGPVTLVFDHKWLRALADSASAALEFSESGGRA